MGLSFQDTGCWALLGGSLLYGQPRPAQRGDGACSKPRGFSTSDASPLITGTNHQLVKLPLVHLLGVWVSLSEIRHLWLSPADFVFRDFPCQTAPKCPLDLWMLCQGSPPANQTQPEDTKCKAGVGITTSPPNKSNELGVFGRLPKCFKGCL